MYGSNCTGSLYSDSIVALIMRHFNIDYQGQPNNIK